MIEFLCQTIEVPVWAILIAIVTGGAIIIIPNFVFDNDY